MLLLGLGERISAAPHASQVRLILEQVEAREAPDADEQLARAAAHVAGELVDQHIWAPEQDHARNNDVLCLSVGAEAEREEDQINAGHYEQEGELNEQHGPEAGVDSGVNCSNELVLCAESLHLKLDPSRAHRHWRVVIVALRRDGRRRAQKDSRRRRRALILILTTATTRHGHQPGLILVARPERIRPAESSVCAGQAAG